MSFTKVNLIAVLVFMAPFFSYAGGGGAADGGRDGVVNSPNEYSAAIERGVQGMNEQHARDKTAVDNAYSQSGLGGFTGYGPGGYGGGSGGYGRGGVNADNAGK